MAYSQSNTNNGMEILETGLVSVFSVPIGVYKIDANFEKISKIIEEHPQQPPPVLLKKGTSNYTINNIPDILDNPEIGDLKKKLQTVVDDYANNIGLKKLLITDNWFANLKLGGRIESHIHEHSAVSGTFYPKANGNSYLKFTNPTKNYRLVEQHNELTGFNTNTLSVKCETGKVILFPSWLEHRVDEIDEDGRQVIAFNCIH